MYALEIGGTSRVTKAEQVHESPFSRAHVGPRNDTVYQCGQAIEELQTGEV